MAAGESYCIMFPGDYFFMLQEESEYNTAEKDGDYTVGFFIQLKEKGQKAVLEWCMSVGLIASKYECPKCGNDMRLCPRKGSIDGFKWRCRRKVAETFHEVSKSIRKGTWFNFSHLSICDILLVNRYWFGRCMNDFVVQEMKLNKNTVVDWYMCCREVCMASVMNESIAIGGTGTYVEIYENKFGKLKSGRMDVNGSWVFCGIERETKKYFFRVVEQRSKEDLFLVLEQWVLPGSTIISDLWRVYDCLSDEDFVNLKDEHSLTYIVSDPSGEHDGTGNSWSSVKEFLKYHAAHSAGHFDAYFAEFIWRWSRDHSFSDDVFRDFIQAVISMFPPPERDIPPT
ncbi:uncharacterized protein TNCV_486001 [Trichonephila clavipes]|nr:uncharacterized protein TNCV_486001 [Trichonephila clavipes]